MIGVIVFSLIVLVLIGIVCYESLRENDKFWEYQTAKMNAYTQWYVDSFPKMKLKMPKGHTVELVRSTYMDDGTLYIRNSFYYKDNFLVSSSELSKDFKDASEAICYIEKKIREIEGE